MPSCPGCQKEVRAQSKFCPFCGEALTPRAAEPDVSLAGHIPADVLARRIEPREMQGLLNKTVVVEEGHSALLLIGGRHDLTLGPGKHAIGNILSSRTRDATVVLFRTSDVPLGVSVSRLHTSDPLPLNLDFRLVLKTEAPMRLWSNLAGGAGTYNTQHLAAALYPLVEEGCEAFVGSRSVRELGRGQDTGRDLTLSLASRLEQPLSRWGLSLVSSHAVSVRCEAWDEVTQARSEYYLTAAEEQAGLEGRKRLFDVFQDSELQAMAQETVEVIGVEKRVSLWERLRQAMLSNAEGELRSKAELDEVLDRADRDRLLKEDERLTLQRTISEASEDHEKARAYLLRKVEVEGEYELEKLDLGRRFGLSRERLALEVATARREMDGKWELELSRLDGEIEQQRRWAEFRRDQEAADEESGSRTQLGAARTAAAIEDIEREGDAKDLGMLIEVYGQYRGVKSKDELERDRIQLERQQGELELRLREDRETSEIRIKESRHQHDQELERIEALSGVGIETLIAVSGPEQAQMLTQLARTRAFAGCSPQQILAMQAESSPQVADALREILTATAASGQLEQYERLVYELKENAKTSREDYQRNITTMNEMFNKALDTVKDTAVAFSSVASTATAQHPDLRPHTAPDGTITLIFSDIEGSTAMTERLGDQQAQEVLRSHNSIVRRQVEAHGGFEVKSMGDGFMLAFSGARTALQCAMDIQRSLAGYNVEHRSEPLRVRMGLHTGEAIKEGEDFFGRNVILAARISAKADGGQIMVSSTLKAMTESGGDIKFSEGLEVELKGLAGTTRLYRVHWE